MRPSKFEWIIAGVLFLFLFSSWNFSDTKAIVGHEVDFADSIVHGEFANFYQRAYDRSKLPGRCNPNYDLPVNLVLGIWGLPLYLYGGTEYANDFWKILYGKSLFFLAFLVCTFLVYKICREFEVDEDKSQWAAFIYFTSSMAINSVCLVGNLDALGAALTLAGVLAYIRHKDFQCLLWFTIAFPFKQHAAFIYLPLLLLRDKNILRVSFRMLIIMAFTMICDIPIYNTPGVFAEKYRFTAIMISRLFANRIPFLSEIEQVPIFMILYGLLCIYCYLHEYPSDIHEQNSLTLTTAMLGIAVTLSFISSHPQWFIHLAPYLAIACVYYCKIFKDALLLETLGSLALLGYNYMLFTWVYTPVNAASMLMYKLIAKPVQVTGIKISDININSIADKTNHLLDPQKVIFIIRIIRPVIASVYAACMIALIFMLFKPSNIDTQNRMNIRAYALTRMFMNFIACYIPLMIFVIKALH